MLFPSHCRTILLLITLGFLAASAPEANAATITWGAPQNISGDSDVNTDGTLLGAGNLGGLTIYIVMTTTINGVTFVALPNCATLTSGSFTASFTSCNAAADLSGQILSAAYSALLQTYAGNTSSGPVTLTMTGLSSGHLYEFEWWANSRAPGGNDLNTATAGNSVTLQTDTSSPSVGLGQFAIGTFTADAPSQVITFTGAPDVVINGFQLRDLSPASSIPEPTSLALSVLGVLGGTLHRLSRGWGRRGTALRYRV
jgi:hypothetical protein